MSIGYSRQRRVIARLNTLGEHTSSCPLSGARQARRVTEIPSVRMIEWGNAAAWAAVVIAAVGATVGLRQPVKLAT